jgi:hypothetical protein
MFVFLSFSPLRDMEPLSQVATVDAMKSIPGLSFDDRVIAIQHLKN